MNIGAKIQILGDLLISRENDREETAVNCPVPTIIGELVEEGLESDLGRAVWPHVRDCIACRDLYNRLSAFSGVGSVREPGEEDGLWAAANPRLEKALSHQLENPGNSSSEPASNRIVKFRQSPQTRRWGLVFSGLAIVAGILIIVTNVQKSSLDGVVETQGTSVARNTKPAITGDGSGAAPSGDSSKGAKGVELASDRTLGYAGPESVETPALTAASPAVRREQPASSNPFLPPGTQIRLKIDSIKKQDLDSNFRVQGQLFTTDPERSFASFSAELKPGSKTSLLTITQVSVGTGASSPPKPMELLVAIFWVDPENSISTQHPLAGKTVKVLDSGSAGK